MAILVFDIGGTAVKYALYKDEMLTQNSSFETPSSWQAMKEEMWKVKQLFALEDIEGIAMSSPGSVDSAKGVIRGISAVPYIHHFPIIKELEDYFQLSVTIENDANCAALAEVSFGVARDVQNAAFFIIGSGIGGAVVMNRQVHKGKHLFGGEFGYMLMTEHDTLSPLASPVQVAKRYGVERKWKQNCSGKQLFALADKGEKEAQQMVSSLYDLLARGIYNVLMVLDPDMVAIGGGISQRIGLKDEIEKRLMKFIAQTGAIDLQFRLEICQFQNDANLLGAVSHFLKEKRKRL